MNDVTVMALRTIVLAMNDIRKKLDYSNKPEYVKSYCECIERLAITFTNIQNTHENTVDFCSYGERREGE